MSHTGHCENAKGYKCVCPCGGALHGAILVRGISSTERTRQDTAKDWAEPSRWSNLKDAPKQSTLNDNVCDRRPAMTGVVSELVIALIEQVREESEVDAIGALAGVISDEVGRDFENHLQGGGSTHGSSRHLWCVVLATICRLYSQGFTLAKHSVKEYVHQIMETLRNEISKNRTDRTQARDIYAHRHLIVEAFEMGSYIFLDKLVVKAVESLMAAVETIGEEAVMKYLRIIAAIICPDPDGHPDVVKYCIWPLISGPFSDLLDEAMATEMRKWVRNAYVTVSY